MARTRPLRLAVILTGLALTTALAGCGGKRVRPAADIAASRVTQIGVNSYLWRASLDTLSFMPLLQTDSDGGVILTDWFINPRVPGERMKLTVTILDQDLRADALRVAIHAASDFYDVASEKKVWSGQSTAFPKDTVDASVAGVAASVTRVLRAGGWLD